MEMQWNLQCGIMWNQYEPQQECPAERTVSNLRDNLPYALPAAAPRSDFALFQSQTGELGIAFKENDREKLVMTSEKPFATASLESLFDVFPAFVPLRFDDRCLRNVELQPPQPSSQP